MHGRLHFPTPIFIPILQYSSSSFPPCLHGRAWPHKVFVTPSQPCNIHVNTHLSIPIFMQIPPLTTFSLYIRVPTITQTSMRASPLQWLGNGQQPSKPFVPHEPRQSRLWSSALLLQFGAPLSRPSTAARAPSSSTASAAWSTAPSAKTSTCWCRGFESHISPPSQRRPRSHHPFPSLLRRCWWRPRLKELPRWRGMPWAVMEFVLVMGLGLSMMDIRLEKKPSLGVLMEGSMFPQINGL